MTDLNAVITAPFTPEQVTELRRHQNGGWAHGLTCARHSSRLLVVLARGLYCAAPGCGFEQTTVPAFAADPVVNTAGEAHVSRMRQALTDPSLPSQARDAVAAGFPGVTVGEPTNAAVQRKTLFAASWLPGWHNLDGRLTTTLHATAEAATEDLVDRFHAAGADGDYEIVVRSNSDDLDGRDLVYRSPHDPGAHDDDDHGTVLGSWREVAWP